MGADWDPDDLVAARLIVNIHLLVAHESRGDVVRKTGIPEQRLDAIMRFAAYPDGYEIARFQHAYGKDIWPRTDASGGS